MLLMVLSFSGCRPTPETDDLPDLPIGSDLQLAIEDVLNSNPTDPPLGISSAVIAPGYKPWIGAAGYSHPGAPISTEWLFNVGSVEKMFQAALVVQLAEEGRIGLDDHISAYLGDLPNVDGQATIRQLLNHTSGVFNVFEHPDFPWVGEGVDYTKRWELQEVCAKFLLEPYGDPGQVQHYSSTNYLLLTEIVENVTGSTVPEEIRTRFLAPLDLDNTTVSMVDGPPARFSVAHGWVDLDGDGELDELGDISYRWITSLTHPVLFTTAEDLVRWTHALFQEQSVLDREQVAEMLTVPELTQYDPAGGLYGLGIVDYSNVLGRDAIGHAGSSLGYSSAALYLPDEGVTVVWMINTGESPTALAESMMWDAWSALISVIDGGQTRSR